MLSMLRSSLVSEGTNPITQHYRLVRLVGGAGQEMVWKIYEAFRIKDGKVSQAFTHILRCNFMKKLAEIICFSINYTWAIKTCNFIFNQDYLISWSTI